ncbi:hypothetical protein CDAR_205831 [Caerostris darwini]|uniref:Uncharacterized protein n=1 Tax=Caerostris darwini TaxID=1538125 RepID=A0AAV4QTC1_9ARAC|nr:hypothetical protein CDAR_205831 [Caerostris darwini]
MICFLTVYILWIQQDHDLCSSLCMSYEYSGIVVIIPCMSYGFRGINLCSSFYMDPEGSRSMNLILYALCIMYSLGVPMDSDLCFSSCIPYGYSRILIWCFPSCISYGSSWILICARQPPYVLWIQTDLNLCSSFTTDPEGS